VDKIRRPAYFQFKGNDMSTQQVCAIKLRNHHFGNEWFDRVEDRWNYVDFLANVNWRKNWISFDGTVYCAETDRVYCGITSFDADIFKAYDRKQKRFVDLGFSRAANSYDAKFHRAMAPTKDGKTIYTATALLHDIDRYRDAPGGGIFMYDIATEQIKKLGIPIPHDYIQSIVLDEKRDVIYCAHFTPEYFSIFDLQTRQTRNVGLLGNGFAMAQGENIILDDEGCAWSGWAATRAWQENCGADSHRLCKYDPSAERIIFYDRGLPRKDGARGTAKLEGLFNFGTGCLYASGDNGSLYRIDTRSGQAVYLGTPIRKNRSRLASMVKHPDGYAYGIVGRDGHCRLLRFDPRNDNYEVGDMVIDEEGIAMWQCHDITCTPDGVLYAGENDNPYRSSYLWEIKI